MSLLADDHNAALQQLEIAAFADDCRNFDAVLHQVHLLSRRSRWEVPEDDGFWKRLGNIEAHLNNSIKKQRTKKLLAVGGIGFVCSAILTLLAWNYACIAYFKDYTARMEKALLNGDTTEVNSLLREQWKFDPGRSGAANALKIRSLASGWLATKKASCEAWLVELGRAESELEKWSSLTPETRSLLIKQTATLQSFHEANINEFTPSDARRIGVLAVKATTLDQEWMREKTTSAELALSILDSCLSRADGVFGEPLVSQLPEMRRAAAKVAEEMHDIEERLAKRMARALGKYQQMEEAAVSWVKSFDQMAGEHASAETHAQILRNLMANLPEHHQLKAGFAQVLDKGLWPDVLHQQAMHKMGLTADSSEALFPARPCTAEEIQFLKQRLPVLEASAGKPPPDSPDTYRYHLKALASWAASKDYITTPQFTQSALFFLDHIYADPWMKPFEKALLCQVVDGVIKLDPASWGLIWSPSATNEIREVLKLVGDSPEPLLSEGTVLAAEKLVMLESYFTDRRDVDFQQEASALQLLVKSATSWEKVGVVAENGKLHFLGELPGQCVLLAWGNGSVVVGFQSSLGKTVWLNDRPMMGSPAFCRRGETK
ncbi:MAG: hypothetical protein JNN17_23065 [Verrucomicrobiaceae bacterium]|nr:hypothetical protein [Verrucomicrobiaceae bacterium]